MNDITCLSVLAATSLIVAAGITIEFTLLRLRTFRRNRPKTTKHAQAILFR